MFQYSEIVFNHINETMVIRNLGKMAAQIAYYNFEWRFVTFVIFHSIHPVACVEAFLSSYNKPVAIKMGEFIPHLREHVSQFVIFGHDSNELSNILAWFAKSKFDVSARIIIVCANADHRRCDQDEVFPTISGVFMMNSVFLQPTENKYQPTVLTYYPMKPNNCTNRSPEVMNIDLRCSNHSCRSAFPEKLGNYYGCALYISTIHQPPYMYLHNDYDEPYGADGDIIKFVATILNATLRMKLPIEKTEWGRNVGNNWTGTLGDVFNKRVHASMASIPLTSGKNGNFQISFSYASMEMVWVARLPDLKAPWEKLVHPLKLKTRLVLLVSFTTILLIDVYLRSKRWNKIRRRLNIARSKSNLLFKSWVLFLGMSISRMPLKATLRIIVFCWIWFALIIRSAYQASLFDTIKTDYYEDYFADFAEVFIRRYPYGGEHSLRECYSEDKNIFEKWTVITSTNILDVLDEIAKGNTDFVLAQNKAAIIHHLLQSNVSNHLQIIPKPILISPTVLYFKKFSPYAPAVNRVLRILVEAGFTDMFYARYLDLASYLFEHSQVYGPAPLGMSHFTACFMFLVAGWCISALYFAIEIFFNKHREQQTHYNVVARLFKFLHIID